MYRGSRLAASFLLLLTGAAALAVAAFVLSDVVGPNGIWVVVPLAIAFGIAHFVALVGLVRGRTWARDLAVSIAEAGGGIAIATAVAVVMGARLPAASGALSAADRSGALGLLVWFVGLYALLGLSAGRIRFAGWRRRSVWWPTPLLGIGA
jgi:hypothetical protein